MDRLEELAEVRHQAGGGGHQAAGEEIIKVIFLNKKYHKILSSTIFTESAPRPIQSESRDVRVSVRPYVCVKFILRPLIGPQVT